MIAIELVSQLTDEVLEAIAHLLPQLKVTCPPLTRSHLAALIDSDSSLLFVARQPAGTIVGMLTLIVYRVPSGVRARIEDVVVDESVRGQGIGEALVRRSLEEACSRGADGVALTSNPRRQAANRLYQRIGFQRWETNVYFYRFESSG